MINQNSNVKKSFTFVGGFALLKSIFAFAMAVLPSVANAQWITNSCKILEG